jgi:multicomponent Na+:H+ antiporter subunit G
MTVPTVVAELVMLAGALVALLAGVGLLRFSTPYARFHAAGKASPVALLLVSVGAAPMLGVAGAAHLNIAAVATVLTLPVGVHLLFRAVHRSTDGEHLTVDELTPARRAQRAGNRGAEPRAAAHERRDPLPPTNRKDPRDH